MAIYNNRVCRTCGCVFSGGPRSWYCQKCRIDRRRKQDRERKKSGSNRHLGSVDKCLNCGKEYTVESGTQKYCSDCRDEMYRKLDNEQGINYYYQKIDKEERKIKRKIYRARNREKIRAKKREYYRENKERIHERVKKYNNAHKEKLQINNRIYHLKKITNNIIKAGKE